ncbi:hypothetical protein CPLU01_13478 [Colletotrichum plurivorum]|uniref:RING-type domain-containing protein n=1 Tax=Colletotrichum plurivorum TaxID=2175906 RepID=A0A8H6JR62_9PEZI|nr:hypothetical protein CPLU01_13478 [Colletotrichum plurivorum]
MVDPMWLWLHSRLCRAFRVVPPVLSAFRDSSDAMPSRTSRDHSSRKVYGLVCSYRAATAQWRLPQMAVGQMPRQLRKAPLIFEALGGLRPGSIIIFLRQELWRPHTIHPNTRCEQSADISLEDIPRPYTCKPPDAQGPHVVPAEWFEANTALENEERDKVISADQASGLFQADFPPYFLHDGLVVHRKRTCNCVKERCCEMCLPDPPGCCGITQDAIPTHFLEDDDKCPTCLEVAAHYTVKTCGHITCTFCWKECLYNAMPDCTQCEFELLVFPPMGFNPYSFELVTYQTSLTAYPDLKPPETWPEKPDQPDETSKPGVHNAEEKTSDNSDMIKRGALTSVI